MFNSDKEMLSACSDDPSVIFTLIKQGEFEAIQLLIEKNKIDVNVCDGVGNDVCTRLLKAKQYSLVLQLMKKRNWDVNHQNYMGETFGHILALDNSAFAAKVAEALISKSNFNPDIKNDHGETMLERAIDNNHVSTSLKILEDKRVNNIDLLMFQKLFKTCIKNRYYGKYSKLNNLEVIVTNLDKKELMPSVKMLVEEIKENYEIIKKDILNNKSNLIDELIASSMSMANA